MRKVIYSVNMSIDGRASHMSFMPDEEIFEVSTHLMNEVDLVAFGRKMYELMFPYWALPENRGDELETEFAERLTSLDKIVFSRTLQSADYNTRVVRTDPVAELLRLKQTPGGNILVGTVSMVAQLAEAGVIDEYRLVVHPALVGQGPSLIEGGSLAGKIKLKLLESKAFKSGCVLLKYAKS